ncbi:hypothetical protein HG530_004364 [Fusarium avenaceum]|nr:hypothetical protein HG530_004364 [Fusarium avenaceum]
MLCVTCFSRFNPFHRAFVSLALSGGGLASSSGLRGGLLSSLASFCLSFLPFGLFFGFLSFACYALLLLALLTFLFFSLLVFSLLCLQLSLQLHSIRRKLGHNDVLELGGFCRIAGTKDHPGLLLITIDRALNGK